MKLHYKAFTTVWNIKGNRYMWQIVNTKSGRDPKIIEKTWSYLMYKMAINSISKTKILFN